MMIRAIYLSIIILVSSSNALVNRRQDSNVIVTPSENQADFETAKNNCEREFNGKLLVYTDEVEIELKRTLRIYNCKLYQTL